MYKSRTKENYKSAEKMLNYRILFKDILTCLGLDYRDASLITIYLDEKGIFIPKIR